MGLTSNDRLALEHLGEGGEALVDAGYEGKGVESLQLDEGGHGGLPLLHVSHLVGCYLVQHPTLRHVVFTLQMQKMQKITRRPLSTGIFSSLFAFIT